MNIAIVGFGVAGANILRTLINHNSYTHDMKIHIFEEDTENAVGIAYQEDTIHKVLNVDEKYMSFKANNDLDKWLEQNGLIDNKIEGMLPRSIYGDFIKESMARYINSPNVSIIHQKVIDIYKDGNYYKILTEDKEQDPLFDVVFLSIGQSYYKDSYKLKGEKNYINNPFPLVAKLDEIKDGQKVGIIGAGPTAIDIYRYLRKFKNIENPLYFFTLTNGFPPIDMTGLVDDRICSINEKWVRDNLSTDGFLPLDRVIDQVRDDFKKSNRGLLATYEKYKSTDIRLYKKTIDKADKALGFAQIYTMELTEHIALIYNSLDGLDQITAIKEYAPIIDFIATKTPYQTMENIIEDYTKDYLKIIKGTQSIKVNDDGFIIRSESSEEIKTDIIINAQGFETDLTEAIKNDQLLRNLYKRKFIYPDDSGRFINVTYPSYKLLSKKYGLMDRVYLSGMWAGGTDILNNDLRSILKASALVANDFMDSL